MSKIKERKQESRNKKSGENEEKTEWEAKKEEKLLNLFLIYPPVLTHSIPKSYLINMSLNSSDIKVSIMV